MWTLLCEVMWDSQPSPIGPPVLALIINSHFIIVIANILHMPKTFVIVYKVNCTFFFFGGCVVGVLRVNGMLVL